VAVDFAPADYDRLREACEMQARALDIEASVYNRVGWRPLSYAASKRREHFLRAALTFAALGRPATQG
jgi:hypothetical protein